MRAQAREPEKIEALIQFVSEDLGYRLHQAVQKTKASLSRATAVNFQLSDGPINIDTVTERQCFESWTAGELAKIEACVDSLLTTCDVKPAGVNMVSLTGGSSFVPAVRRIFEQRFGPERSAKR